MPSASRVSPAATAMRSLEDDADRAGETGHQTEPGKDARRYAGRHAGHRGKTARTRSRRVLVPAAAVAATIAAGTAAVYGLSGGQPQAADANTSLALHGAVASTPGSGIGNANGTASAPIKVATGTASDAARPAGKHAKRFPQSHADRGLRHASPAARHAKATASAPAQRRSTPRPPPPVRPRRRPSPPPRR